MLGLPTLDPEGPYFYSEFHSTYLRRSNTHLEDRADSGGVSNFLGCHHTDPDHDSGSFRRSHVHPLALHQENKDGEGDEGGGR
jgi:hypothetical protein